MKLTILWMKEESIRIIIPSGNGNEKRYKRTLI